MEDDNNNNSSGCYRIRINSVDYSGDTPNADENETVQEEEHSETAVNLSDNNNNNNNNNNRVYHTRINSVDYNEDSSKCEPVPEKAVLKQESIKRFGSYRTRLNSADYNEDTFKCEPTYQKSMHKVDDSIPKKAHHARINSVECDDFDSIQKDHRLVVVRYFLDRPGYDLNTSASRLWFHPPSICTPKQVQEFLKKQGIALENLLVEVYLDKFKSFMLLEACMASCIEWNFQDTTYRRPGVLNIRLTDMDYAQQLDDTQAQQQQQQGFQKGLLAPAPTSQQQIQHANTTPVGLFSFSIMVGLETTALTGKLIQGTVASSFVLAWGPYMFYVGGLLQILTGIFQVLRNNIYGAVAFMGFGSFWFANGTRLILETHVAGDVSEEILLTPDPWGACFRSLYILAFSLVLLKQTFVMNKLSTTLITLLCCKLAVQAFAGWSKALQWIQFGFGWVTSFFAFYVFLVEFTNQVYHREVFQVHKWSAKESPEEVFGYAGRTQTLFSKAARLRHANYPNVSGVRSVLPAENQQQNQVPTSPNNCNSDNPDTHEGASLRGL